MAHAGKLNLVQTCPSMHQVTAHTCHDSHQFWGWPAAKKYDFWDQARL